MKIGIEIRKEYEKIFTDVVQKNGGKPGTVARLIIESQLSFFLSRKVLPNYFQSVNFSLDKNKELPQQEESDSSERPEEEQETNHKFSWEIEAENRGETEDMTDQFDPYK